MEQIEYPIRINRYLALKQYASRREADRLISDRHVRINGRIAVLGDVVQKGDSVTVSANMKRINSQRVYLAYYKPAGIVTHSPERGQRAIADVLEYREKLFPIGRLDKDSRGLIMLTNDGRITDKLLNPDKEHEKEYVVRVDKPIHADFIKKMHEGVRIDDDYVTRKCDIQKTGTRVFRIILTEGKKHQIRRMCAAFGYEVTDIFRIRIMNIGLGNLHPGAYRELKGKELDTFLQSIGIKR